MVEIAVSILRAKPEDNIRPAREWTVDVISKYSEVPLTKSVREALLVNPKVWGKWDYSYDSKNEYYWEDAPVKKDPPPKNPSPQ